MLNTIIITVICLMLMDEWIEKRQIKFKAKALYRKTKAKWQSLISIFTRDS